MPVQILFNKHGIHMVILPTKHWRKLLQILSIHVQVYNQQLPPSVVSCRWGKIQEQTVTGSI